MKELTKRIITSLFLFSLLILAFIYSYIMIISLILIIVIAWIEFRGLTYKIFNGKKNKTKVLRFAIKIISLIYLIIFAALIFDQVFLVNSKLNTIYLFLLCICSDIGGLTFGKIFKGKKLTKISPNKTISGSIGSFGLSIIMAPIFYYVSGSLDVHLFNLFDLMLLSIIVSLFCQLGDLFISFLKRKAKVKNTSNLLPGHGGILDRIDGMLFAIPIGIMIWEILTLSI
tara:strand:- start:581 stop:1264 length:684 start_codon:yes stop_codon:yes gene_type:complete